MTNATTASKYAVYRLNADGYLYELAFVSTQKWHAQSFMATVDTIADPYLMEFDWSELPPNTMEIE